jgi:serine/threonine-protein kinase
LKEQFPSIPVGTGKLPVGQIVGNRYLVLRKIAQGGMGAVYEVAETSPSNRRLALKEMSLSVLQDLPQAQRQEVIMNFQREFEFLRDLHHPNLVQAFEYFEENNRQYFVMEFLEGQTLEHVLENVPSNSFLPTDRVLDWAYQLCDVLSYLHAQKPPIIYRDLKPSNIIEIVNSRIVKIFDFGIARFYKAGKKGDTIAFGTLGYLAPEIAGHLSQTNEKTDIYALGVVLHQLLTNYDPLTDPYQLPSILSINPAVPQIAAKAIQHALENDPDKRTPTATAMLKELCGPKAKPSWQSNPAASVHVSAPNPLPPYPPPSAKPQPQKAQSPELLPKWVAVPSPQGQPSLGNSIQQGLPASSVSLSVSPSSIHLGSVQYGKTAQGKFQVKVPQNIHGDVIPLVPWLTTQPQNFSQGEQTIAIIAKTSNLSCGPWQPAGQKWYIRLPSWLQKWINLHAFHIVRGQIRHNGRISLNAVGANPVEVLISVDVCSAAWRVGLGWAFVIVLLLLETALLISPLLLLAMTLF